MVLDVFRLRYLIPSQSWQCVRPSFIFFSFRGICWLHIGQIQQLSCQRHFGHLMINVYMYCTDKNFQNDGRDFHFYTESMNRCFLFRRFRFQLCLWQPVPLHCSLLHHYFQKLFHPLLPPSQYHSPCLRNFFIFLSNRIQAFCFWLTAYRFLPPPVHQVLSARGLITSSLNGRSTYPTSSAMFVTGIVRLFRSSCLRGVQNRISLDVAILCNK